MSPRLLQVRVFLILLVAVSVAFVWLLAPFLNAIFWAIVLAVLFLPMQRRLTKLMPGHRTLPALLTLVTAIVIVLIPLAFITQSLVSELIHLYKEVQGGTFKAGTFYEAIVRGLPTSLQPWLERVGLGDVETIKNYISQFTNQAVNLVGSQALNFGQNTFLFVIELGILLYLLFFFLRDGLMLSGLISAAVPLSEDHKLRFAARFATVVRATIKGNVVVAVCQGVLGGLIFWVLDIPSASLWGTVMGILSLLPAVGAALVWGPVAVYFLATGDVFKGTVLVLYGVLVISLIDNILRPILVGKDTRLPDYMVLLSTLGGLSLFGLSGFVAGPLVAVLFLVAWDMFRVMNTEEDGQNERPLSTPSE